MAVKLKRIPRRAKQIASLYGGKQKPTMEQVAAKLHCSRETIRYHLAKYYPELIRTRGRVRPADRVKLVEREARNVTTWEQLATRTKLSVPGVRAILADAGKLRSTSARFADLREQERKQNLLESMRHAATRMRRTPSATDCNQRRYKLATVQTYYKHFGSLRKAQRMAGLKPNQYYRQLT